MHLHQVIDQTFRVYLAGIVIALLSMGFFTIIGALYALGSNPNSSGIEAVQWAASGLTQWFCLWAYYIASGYWWRFVLRKLEIRGFVTRVAAVLLGALLMSGLLLATSEISRLILSENSFALTISWVSFGFFGALAVLLIFVGRWQLRYNFHSGYGTRVMDYWLLTPSERERLQLDFE